MRLGLPERSAFYNEFAESQEVRGLLALLLVDDGRRPGIAPLTFLGLYRAPGQQEFTADDRRARKSIHAPLQMALRAHCALSASRQSRRTADAALAAVDKPNLVLDREGRVLHANAVAVIGLSLNRWLALRSGRLVGLTSAERRVLAPLAQGLGVAEIAAASGVTVHTVRTHPKHLFEKTGTGRQSDLIRLLSGA